jgi:hypothetical protein
MSSKNDEASDYHFFFFFFFFSFKIAKEIPLATDFLVQKPITLNIIDENTWIDLVTCMQHIHPTYGKTILSFGNVI